MTIICRLCKEKGYPDAPLFLEGLVYLLNPLTFRWAWMHEWCYMVAQETISDIVNPKRGINRLEEYNEKFEL